MDLSDFTSNANIFLGGHIFSISLVTDVIMS
jgi:hypothetical protein